jgi:hypothetical protein
LRLKGRGREEERGFHTAFGNDVPCGVSTTTTITAIATCQQQQQLRKDTAAATKRIVLSPLIDK